LRRDPQGFCIIRTQGTRLELLATAVRSVIEQKPRITPCVVVHGNQDVFSDLRDWLAKIDTSVLVLHAPATDRKRGYPCNVALDFLKENPQAYDFLCFLDDDDHLLPGFSERLTEAAWLSRADVVFGLTNALSETGAVQAMHPLLPTSALFIDNFIPINAYIVRTDAALACAARFDETINYLEDWDFLLQLLGAGARFVALFETVSEFRLIGDGNVAVKRDPMHFEECAVRIRTRTRAALDSLSPGIFWRDVVDFPEDQVVFLETRQLRQLEAARTLFKASGRP
jgi:glycosyltransferase involved in cell wall biosynthesis